MIVIHERTSLQLYMYLQLYQLSYFLETLKWSLYSHLFRVARIFIFFHKNFLPKEMIYSDTDNVFWRKTSRSFVTEPVRSAALLNCGIYRRLASYGHANQISCFFGFRVVSNRPLIQNVTIQYRKLSLRILAPFIVAREWKLALAV